MRRTEIKPLPFLHQAIPSGLSFQHFPPSSIRYQSFPLSACQHVSFCPRLRLSLSVFRSQPSAFSFQPFSLLLPPSPRLIRFANPYGLPLAFYLPAVGCVALRAAFGRVDARLWSSTLRAPAGAASISKRFALSGYPRGLPRRWSAFQHLPSATPHAIYGRRGDLRFSLSAFPSSIFHLSSLPPPPGHHLPLEKLCVFFPLRRGQWHGPMLAHDRLELCHRENPRCLGRSRDIAHAGISCSERN